SPAEPPAHPSAPPTLGRHSGAHARPSRSLCSTDRLDPSPDPKGSRGMTPKETPKARTGRAGSRPKTPKMHPPARGVKIRMYRTGLGDCFLLAFKKVKKGAGDRDAFYMLIDCGVYKGTPKEQNAPWIE